MSGVGGDRGQSELLGLVLLIGITVAGVTAVLAFGTSALQESKQTVYLSNAEQTLTEFDSEVSLVALGRIEKQRTTFSLADIDSRVFVRTDAGWMNVSVTYPSNESVRLVIMNVTMGAVVYENSGTRIAYQGGGVWRRSGGGSVMVSPPEFHYRTGGTGSPTLTLPMVTVDGGGSIGETIVIQQNGTTKSTYPTEVLSNPLPAGQVEITVKSEYYEAWGAFFEQRTDGSVTYDHANETVAIALVSKEQDISIDGGLVGGAPGSNLDIKSGALVDSYNSSVGNYTESSGNDTEVVIAGDVVLRSGSAIRGNLHAGGSVTMKSNTDIFGNLRYGESLTTEGSAQIHGWTAQNASVDKPAPATTLIDSKRNAFQGANNNDNGRAGETIENIENGDCTPQCVLHAGEYYLDRIQLSSSGILTFDTSEGNVDVVVDGDFSTKSNAKINVTGEGRVNLYVEEDVTLKSETKVLVPGDDSTQLWIFLNPGATVDLKAGTTFVGVIYGAGREGSPGADITIRSGGEVFGAVIGDIGDIKAHREIHYDSALAHVEAVPSDDDVPLITYLHVSVTRVNVSSG